MEDDVHEHEIDDIACAIELSLLDLNHQDKEFVATDEASSSFNYLDENKDEEDDDDIIRAIEESLKPSNLNYDRRGNIENGLVCDVCDKLVIRTEMKRIEFWNQNICDVHRSDSTPRCCGCNRFKTNEVEYIRLSDEQNICPNCYSTAILDDQKCRPLVQNCYSFFEMLEMKLRKDIQFYLVDILEMTRLVDDDATSSNPMHPTTKVRGLTMINSPPIESKKSVGKRIKVEHSKYKGHGCGIQIAVLSGLPKIVTGAILAHEMMHAWFRLQKVVNLEPKVEEGICQVMSCQWLDWFKTDHAGSRRRGDGEEEAQFTKNLMKYFKLAIAMDSSEEYGEGFRFAQCAVANYGLKRTINHIATHGTLPQ